MEQTYTIEEIRAKVESGQYGAELMLRHLLALYDHQIDLRGDALLERDETRAERDEARADAVMLADMVCALEEELREAELVLMKLGHYCAD